MPRPIQARIDLAALRHNYLTAKKRAAGSLADAAVQGKPAKAWAVVKADAYGHGLMRAATALADLADGFALLDISAAVALRDAGFQQPILLLEGFFEPEDLAVCAEYGLTPAVHRIEQLQMIRSAALPVRLPIYLKLNTGMNRLGFTPEQLTAAKAELAVSPAVGRITLMTHFARADEPQVITTEAQVSRFDAATAHLPGARSLANSGAILGWPQARRDWARPGILLYGADPMPDEGHGLQPVVTLESAVMAVREIAAGEALGYGARFVAERDTRVGLVAMGYADGYPRGVADGTPVAVDGLPTRIIGRVSMDMLTVDLTNLPDAGIGSGVELWGRQVPVNRVARAAGTIAYELLCNVKRVRFSYSG